LKFGQDKRLIGRDYVILITAGADQRDRQHDARRIITDS
jgi:hypothetical protein